MCVALIGERLARGEPSARAGVHSSWAAEASQMLLAVRQLERTSGAFGAAYVVSDGSLPEEAQTLAGALNATGYQGMATARRLGVRAGGGGGRGDVLWVRDMEVCSLADVFVANDVPALFECSAWARSVRARRAARGLPSYDYYGRPLDASPANGWGCPYLVDTAAHVCFGHGTPPQTTEQALQEASEEGSSGGGGEKGQGEREEEGGRRRKRGQPSTEEGEGAREGGGRVWGAEGERAREDAAGDM